MTGPKSRNGNSCGSAGRLHGRKTDNMGANDSAVELEAGKLCKSWVNARYLFSHGSITKYFLAKSSSIAWPFWILGWPSRSFTAYAPDSFA